MDVYLLGAGASKSYEISKTNLKMPLANEFFTTFNKLDISKNGWVLVGAIINYLIENKKISSPTDFSSFEGDIEQIHSEIQIDYLDAIKKDDSVGIKKYGMAYNQLVFLFCSVVNEIQNGGESEFHKNLVLRMKGDDSILTFNWDTLIDQSLFLNTDWSLKNGYYVKPKMIYRDEWINGEKSDSKHFLLKLHGSTNWISSYIFFHFEKKKIEFLHEGERNTLYVFQKSKSEYPCYDGRYMAGYEDFSMGYYPPNLPLSENAEELPEGHLAVKFTQRSGINQKGTSTSEGLVSMPIIIPPVQNKSYEFYGDLFLNIWKKSEEVLSIADKIYILGYSFPKTDISSNDLFKNAFIKRKTVPEIVIINPSPEEIKHKFNFEFGIPDHNIKVYPDYITKDYILPD